MKVKRLVESVESGETLSSNYGWKLGLNELFVTCIIDNSDKKGKVRL